MSDIFEHQVSCDRLKRIMDSLVLESQRGAVIAGAAEIDRCLEGLLLATSSRGKAKGVLAKKIEAVQDSGALSARICRALEALRDVRNSAAHAVPDAAWATTREQRRSLWDYGDGVADAVEDVARTALLHSKVSDFLDSGIAKKRRMTSGDVVQLLLSKGGWVDSLREQAILWELAVGFAIACALIDHEIEDLARRSRETGLA